MGLKKTQKILRNSKNKANKNKGKKKGLTSCISKMPFSLDDPRLIINNCEIIIPTFA